MVWPTACRFKTQGRSGGNSSADQQTNRRWFGEPRGRRPWPASLTSPSAEAGGRVKGSASAPAAARRAAQRSPWRRRPSGAIRTRPAARRRRL